MVFSKSFPRHIEGSSYPRWEEVFLSKEEEAEQERLCKEDNIRMMKECVDDARKIVEERGLKTNQKVLVEIVKEADLKGIFGSLKRRCSGQKFKDEARKGWN